MHQLEYILENETHKIFWGFGMQTDLLIPTGKPDRVFINKKEEFDNPVDSREEI